MGLTDIEGIGSTTADRIRATFGSEDAFLEAAREMQLDRIEQVDGLHGKRAVEIVLRVLGREPQGFLRTPRARRLYDDIIERLLGYANTTYAENRIRLMVPLQDAGLREARLQEALQARDLVQALPRDEVARHLGRVRPMATPDRGFYDGDLALLVDAQEDHEKLVEAGVDRHCRILTPDDAGFHEDWDLLVYAYSQGRLDLEGADNVVAVPFTPEPARVVPDAVLHRFEHNRELLETLRDLHELLGDASPVDASAAHRALELLAGARGHDRSFDGVEQRLRDAVQTMNARFRERVQELEVGGDELLAIMQGDQPKQVAGIQSEILAETREELMEDLGEDVGGVFKGEFPLELDEEVLARKRREIVGRWKRLAHREKAEAAQALVELEGDLREEVRAFLALDHTVAVGSFVLDHDLHPARFGDGLDVSGALHLDLVEDGGVPVDYHVGTGRDEDRVVLLTGANSGGKTTLLETLGQITILAHMGLPVNAREATVEPVEGLWFFTQKRSLDAGAFESFLRTFVPIVTDPSRKLVLADELEAMTELEAAARIIGTFVEELKGTESLGVVVTHMAEHVRAFTSVRIDGIEAKGLTDELELEVDRTPRIGVRARSTPELILQRLARTTEPPERELYEGILAAFDEDDAGEAP